MVQIEKNHSNLNLMEMHIVMKSKNKLLVDSKSVHL